MRIHRGEREVYTLPLTHGGIDLHDYHGPSPDREREKPEKIKTQTPGLHRPCERLPIGNRVSSKPILKVIEVGENESAQKGPINRKGRVAPRLHEPKQKPDGNKPQHRRAHKSQKQPRLIRRVKDFLRF